MFPYLKNKIIEIPGFEDPMPGPFFNEFAVRCPVPPDAIYKAGAEHGFLPGIPLIRFRNEWRDLLLIAVTEKHTESEMNDYLEFLRGVAD